MKNQPLVLLIELNPEIRELEELVLTGSGYRLEIPPPNVDLGAFAAQSHPDVIVIGISPLESDKWHVVDQLQANTVTNAIPVVVISTAEQTAAASQASPNVRVSVVAPYDIAALEAAVAAALGNPPPAAVLPEATTPVPRMYVAAADALTQNARRIILGTIQGLQQIEPYKSRFPELSKGLIDDLGTMLGAITAGLSRNLTPRQVFSPTEVRRSIQEHVRLRRSQGMGPDAAIYDDQLLRDEVDQFLESIIGSHNFTALDALRVSRKVTSYIEELARIIVADFVQSSPDSRG